MQDQAEMHSLDLRPAERLFLIQTHVTAQVRSAVAQLVDW